MHHVINFVSLDKELIDAMFLPGFSTLGSTVPKEILKGGHEGEKQVKI